MKYLITLWKAKTSVPPYVTCPWPFKGLVVGVSMSHPPLNSSYLSCVACLSGAQLFPVVRVLVPLGFFVFLIYVI